MYGFYEVMSGKGQAHGRISINVSPPFLPGGVSKLYIYYCWEIK